MLGRRLDHRSSLLTARENDQLVDCGHGSPAVPPLFDVPLSNSPFASTRHYVTYQFLFPLAHVFPPFSRVFERDDVVHGGTLMNLMYLWVFVEFLAGLCGKVLVDVRHRLRLDHDSLDALRDGRKPSSLRFFFFSVSWLIRPIPLCEKPRARLTPARYRLPHKKPPLR